MFSRFKRKSNPAELSIKEVGAIGESIAKNYLKNKNYKLIAKNWSCKIGEIDLLFMHHNTLVIVEVKTRRHTNFASKNIFLNITRKKQKKLEMLSEIFCKLHLSNSSKTNVRIDAIGITVDSKSQKAVSISHIIAAVSQNSR